MAGDVTGEVLGDDPRVEVGAAADVEALDQVELTSLVERGGVGGMRGRAGEQRYGETADR